MLLRRWEELPEEMKNARVGVYYASLQRKTGSLLMKSIFDRIGAIILLGLLWPVFLLIAMWIQLDSAGDVMFKQKRITQYGKAFFIYKFRTMVSHAEEIGAQVTSKADTRVTKAGKILRKYRLDELPQLINVLKGEMSFVGTRPEVPRYVRCYSEEMLATLLLPAGVTSATSIQYKDEERLLEQNEDAERVYIERILPEKMRYNLRYLDDVSFVYDIKTIAKTIRAVVE